MQISYGHCYFDSEGKPYATLSDAQYEQLKKVFGLDRNPEEALPIHEIANWILSHKSEILAILSQKERQRVRASKPASRGVAKRRNGRASNLGTELPLAKEPATTPQPQ